MKTCSEIRFSVRTPWLLVTTAWPRERASVLVKIRRPARSSQQPGPAHTAPAGRVRPQGRRGQGAGPRQLRGAAATGQSVSQLWQLLGPGCRARTHSAQLTLAWRNPLSGLSTLVTWPQPALARHVTRPCWADCLHHWPGCLWPGAPVEQRAGQPGTGAEINKDYNWTLL